MSESFLANTRSQLEQALTSTPKNYETYKVLTYCRLMVGTSEDKQPIQLKPKQILTIQWLYETMDAPTPLTISFEGVKNVDNTKKHNIYWSNKQLTDWLARNTKPTI